MSCIIVLGCYRTGTSAVAGALHHLGVSMGKEFDKPAASNPKGFFEDLEFKRLFNAITDGRYRDIEGLLSILIKIRDAENPIWGIKDPQLCLFLPQILPLLKDHRVISTIRPKVMICNSLQKAAGFDADFSPVVDHYLAKKKEALELYSGPLLEVEFDKLKFHPAEEVGRIAEFVSLPVKQEAIDFISNS